MTRNMSQPVSKGVLFDLDGTLLDTAPDMIAAVGPICAAQNHPEPDYDHARAYVSTGAAGLLRASLPHLNETEIAGLVPDYLDIYSASLAVKTCLFDGMAELLAELETADILWGVVTNKPAFLTDPLLQQLNLYDRSACVVSGDTLPQRKPAPEPLLFAMAQAELRPETTLYVGDADRDIEAGRNAGMPTVAAAYGYILPDEKASDWQADHMIDHPAEILTIIKQL